MKLKFLFVALVVATLLCAAADAADRRVVVFDFVVERSQGYEWVGLALSEYAAAVIDAVPGFESVDREAVNRLMRRYGYGLNEDSPFEVKDRIRVNLKGGIVVEGACSAGRNEMKLKGSIVDLETGDIVSALDFRVSPFDIFTAQKRLRTSLEKALGRRVKNDWKLLLGTGSKEAYSHFRKGKSLFEMGASEEAIGQLKQAVRKDGKFVEPYIVIGRAMLENAHYKSARDYFEKAVELSPGDHKVYLLLGIVSSIMRDIKAAERYMEKAISLNEDNPDSHYTLAGLYFADRRYEEAEREYRRTVEIDPGMAEGWYGLAVLYSIRGDKEKTLEVVAKAVETGGEPIQERMRNDRDFDWLKTQKDFIWLVGKEKN